MINIYDQVFDESDGSDDSSHLEGGGTITEVYLDEVLNDPVPYEQAELIPATPSTASEEETQGSSRSSSPEGVEVRCCRCVACRGLVAARGCTMHTRPVNLHLHILTG